MILRSLHTTTYTYSEPVSVSHTEVHLAPRATARQTVIEHDLVIHPSPDFLTEREDYFGNQVARFSIHEPHQALRIIATAVVDLQIVEPPYPGLTPPWEQVRAEVRRHDAADSFAAAEFVFDSPRVIVGAPFAAYAQPSFPPARPVLEGAIDLCHRIRAEFNYDPRATTVRTPVDEVLRERRGVCQDFAHLMIASLRSIGLPARYVSGYIRNHAASVGAQASHAWVSVFCPGFGWIDFDPTNDVMPAGDHVTIGWGRDYSDLPPVNGVTLGGGEQGISVDVAISSLPAQA